MIGEISGNQINAYIESFCSIAALGDVVSLESSLQNDILNRGYTIDALDQNYSSALYRAAKNGKLKAVRFLLDHGAEANIQGSFNEACGGGFLEIAQLLFSKNRDLVNNKCAGDNWRPLHFAAKKNHREIVDFLIANGAEINAVTLKNDTALMLALESRSAEVAQAILQVSDVDVKIVNQEGATALHLAALNGNDQVIPALVAKGAVVNVVGRNNWTPLHCAAFGNHQKAVETLVIAGADVTLKTTDNKTAFDLTTNQDIKKYIETSQGAASSVRNASAYKLTDEKFHSSHLIS